MSNMGSRAERWLGAVSGWRGRRCFGAGGVTGGIVEIERGAAKVEVADGVFGTCRLTSKQQASVEGAAESGDSDLASMTAVLAARWKQGKASVTGPAKAGQIRSLRVAALDAAAKRTELELAG